MLILGIETSGNTGGVALSEDGALLNERQLTGQGRRHAQSLIAEIALLFQETARTPAECQGVGISVGPGSFTGLRIGVTCGKTFAYAVGCSVTAVNTLQAIAEECPADIDRLTVIADAQRGDLYVGRYRKQGAEWSPEGPMELPSAQEWIGTVSAAENLAGPAVQKWASQLAAHGLLLPELAVPKAGTICKIAERQFRAGETADVWGLEPYYLRKSSAEEQWERRHGRKTES